MRFMKTMGICALITATTQCTRIQNDDPRATPPVANDNAAAPTNGAPSRTKVAPLPVKLPIDGLPVIGSDRALVTIVEFTDYQCPYCARAEERMATLRATYGDDVRVVIASHPLPMHERAKPAALAALAAAEQGKLAAMHTRLFVDIKSLDDAGILRAATDVGLDLTQFDASRRGPAAAAALEHAEALGRAAGVKGTPTFFVNGRRIVGAQPIDTFKSVIDEELAMARALVTSGVRREDVYAKILADAAPLTADAPPSDDTCANKDGDCHGAPGNAPAADDARVDVPKAGTSLFSEVRIDGAPIRGFARAPVTVVMFADFECPFCARIQPTLRDLDAAYPGKIRLAFKHHPLPMHDHARMASKAALAAQAQGKFWEYQDALFAHQSALDRASLERYARDVGLDMTRFARDLDGTDLDARIVADENDARALGADGTPAVYVNGRLVTGAQPLAVFKAAVDRALAEIK